MFMHAEHHAQHRCMQIAAGPRLEAAVEDEFCQHELVRALDGSRDAPLQGHHALLIHIPGGHPQLWHPADNTLITLFHLG